MPQQPSLGGKGLNLLSLDAGGPRSLSQLKILADLMYRLNFDANDRDIDRPCAVYDMICGVGSGGFIAMLLVIFRMTAEQALEEFIGLNASVFDKQGVDAQTRTATLKQFIDTLLRKHGIEENTRLMDLSDRSCGCKLVVPISYKDHIGSTYNLRNFRVRQEQLGNLTIAEALCATLAMPPLFNPTSVFKDAATFEYIGADLTLSNPIQEVIAEAYGAFGPEERVACLVSIGCGHSGVISAPENKELADWNHVLNRLVVDGDQKARNVDSQMGHLGLYHRFSVPQGLETYPNIDTPAAGGFLAHTAVYLADPSVSRKADSCLASLRARAGVASLDQLKHSGGQIVPPPSLPPVSRAFVMRTKPWEFMEKVLLGSSVSDGPRMLAVTGIGGCGKTQLVLKFMRVYESHFASRFVIDGSSEPRIRADTLRHVRSLGTEHSQKDFEECLLFLAQTTPNGPRLILYDNVDDPDIELDPLLPQGDSCALIFTSRNRSIGELCPDAQLELDVMSMDEAIELVLKPTTGSVPSSQQTRDDACAIAEALGCLPIALMQARSYMFQTKCSTRVYLERLKTNRDRLLSQPMKNQRDMRYLSTYAAFEASFAKLPLRVQRLLRLLSYFHWNKLPLELINIAASHNFSDYETNYNKVGNEPRNEKDMLKSIFLHEGKWSMMDLDDMMVALQNYSLVTVVAGVGTMLVQMHPLAHAWLQSCIPEADRPTYQSAAVLLLALGARKDDTPATQYLTSHVTHMATLWNELSPSNAEGFASILDACGQWHDARTLRERVLLELKAKFDPPISYNFGGSDSSAGYHRGEGVFVEGDIVGERHLAIADASGNLASTYINLGRFQEAVDLLENTTKSRKATLGERHVDTLDASDALAFTYGVLGRLHEAEILQIELLGTRKEMIGENHRDTLAAAGALARTYTQEGRLEEAKSLLEETMIKSNEVLGGHHQLSMNASANLAVVYTELGRLEEAESLMKTELKLRQEVHGPRHPHTITITSNLATVYTSMGRLEEAAALQEEVLALRIELLGKRHPDTITASNNLAITYVGLEDHGAEAESLMKEVLKLRGETFGERHPDTLTASSNLASIYRLDGRPGEAKAIFEVVLKLRMEILGERHPDTLITMVEMAKSELALGENTNALVLLNRADPIISEILGQSHDLYIVCQETRASIQQATASNIPPQEAS